MRSVIAITTGDQDGIGPEVTYKSLLEMEGQYPSLVLIFQGDKDDPSKASKIFQKKFRNSISIIELPHSKAGPRAQRKLALETIRNGISSALQEMKTSFLIFRSKATPRDWVHWSAALAVEGKVDAMVTAPMSKSKSMGHTEILMAETRTRKAFMGFIGTHFSVVLGSGHVPLNQSPRMFLADFESSLEAAIQLRRYLPKNQQLKPICVLGINPHAGENGKIGREDVLLQKKVESFRKKGHRLIGPVSADAAFAPGVRQQASIYLAAYHDQGLIPFKALHGFKEALHVTLGIPILRTSVDHGTAKDIFGKNLANPDSMSSAFRFCLKQLKEKKC